jgi:hypothetical protein
MIKDLFKSWLNVFLRLWALVFRTELSRQGYLKTFVGLMMAALLGLGLSWLTHLLFSQPSKGFMGLASVWVVDGTKPPFSSWTVIVPLGVVFGFYDFQIVLFIFARLLGGKGSFGAQAYVQSLFYGPLAVVQQVFAMMPIVGRPLFALLAVYSLIPTTTSLKAAHGYSTWRAVMTWLMPILLSVVIVAVVVMLISHARR